MKRTPIPARLKAPGPPPKRKAPKVQRPTPTAAQVLYRGKAESKEY